MITRFFALLLPVILYVPVLASPGAAQDHAAIDLRFFYGSFVDRAIHENKADASAAISNQENIDDYAMSLMKAAYLQIHREELIGNMIRDQLGKDPERIRSYLSERFLEDLESRGIAAADMVGMSQKVHK